MTGRTTMIFDLRPRWRFLVWLGGVDGVIGRMACEVRAHTKSEARAEVKRILRLKPHDRLPVGTLIERVVARRRSRLPAA